MAKIYGPIGFAETVQTSPGVWDEKITERNYYIEVSRHSRRLQSADQLNDNIAINNEFSIVSDPFADQNYHMIRYVEFMGTKWKITNVEAKYPRLILTAGGVYNG